MRNMKALFLLLLAVLLGLAAAFFASRWVAQRANFASLKVAVAAVDIEPGGRINPQMLTFVEWPAGSVPTGAFSDVKQLQDRVVKVGIPRGDAVLERKLTPPGTKGGLSALISEGKRAMTVRVNDVVGVAGFALPGNFVDVMVNTRKSHGGEETQISLTVLEQVLVLAIAQEASRDETKPKVVSAVTLELSPGEAEKLDLARNVGTLSLVLRNQLDKDSVATRGITRDQLLGLQKAAPPVPVAAKPIVRVSMMAEPPPAPAPQARLRGSDFTRHPFDLLLLSQAARTRTTRGDNNVHSTCRNRKPILLASLATTALGAALFMSEAAAQQQRTGPTGPGSRSAPATAPAQSQDNLPRLACTSVISGEAITQSLGKSRVIQLPSPAIRLIGGGRAGSSMGSTGEPQQPSTQGARPVAMPAQAGGGSEGVAETEITLLSPNELLVLGRRTGSANVIVQDREGRCTVRDIVITADPGTLQTKLRELMPQESGLRVSAAENAMVLTGSVSDTATLDQIMTVATAYGDGKKVVNLMRVSAPQQVMLEVKIAEVSKSLLDRFGLDFSRMIRSGPRFSVFSGILGGKPGGIGSIRPRPDRNGSSACPTHSPWPTSSTPPMALPSGD